MEGLGDGEGAGGIESHSATAEGTRGRRDPPLQLPTQCTGLPVVSGQADWPYCIRCNGYDAPLPPIQTSHCHMCYTPPPHQSQELFHLHTVP